MSSSLSKKKKLRELAKPDISNEAFLFETLKLVVDGIARTFGSRCEVVLHDLRNPKKLSQSIVKIVNGHVTGRAVGGAITNQGLRDLKNGQGKNLFINYPAVAKDGRPLKSSSIILRDDKKQAIAAICINFDVTDIMNYNAAIQDIFRVSKRAEKEDETPETFQIDAASTFDEIVDKAVRKAGKAVPSMGRWDKIEIVRQLEDRGFFLVKGAVKLIAAKLNVSKYTIYNYLEQVHASRPDQKT